MIVDAGFSIEDARYQGRHFVSWTIELSRHGLKPHLLVWDGRDRWIILQSQRGSDWVDEWVIREPLPDTIEQVIAHLTK